jgi:hypothetical protein
MLPQELYVRGINDTEARGPFTVEHLVTLSDTGQIDPDTLYYDAGTEQWATIGSNEELTAAIFPAKRKLGVKPKENVVSLNVPKEEQRAITVEQMLAAAEGRTEETKDKRAAMNAQAVSARIGMYGGLVIFLLSATALLLPNIEIVVALDYAKIIAQPLTILGLVDLVCAVILGLGLAAIYPFVRFRAALGLGFLGLLFWLQGQPNLALAVAAGSVGMYGCTVFLSYGPIIISVLLGLAGMGGFLLYTLR